MTSDILDGPSEMDPYCFGPKGDPDHDFEFLISDKMELCRDISALILEKKYL